MGQHSLSFADQVRANSADGPAPLPIFFLDGQGFLQKEVDKLAGGLLFQPGLNVFLHALQGPEEVNRSWPAGPQISRHIPKLLGKGPALAILKNMHVEDDPHGGGDADGRSASDAPRTDGVPD